MRGRLLPLAAALSAVSCTVAGCAVSWGELPVQCSDGACPAGFECIRGVCAPPGTAVPITVAQADSLRAGDLRLVPTADGALVVWQTYAYSDAGQRFLAARLSPDGTVEPALTLVSSFVADPGAVEPFFDVLAVSSTELLLAVSAPPLPDDADPSARLLVYRVELPAGGQSVAFGPAWPAEERMPTVGYGAVSSPRFVRAGSGASLGYVASRVVDSGAGFDTVAELVVFPLEASGAQAGAPLLLPARAALPVAVGAEAGFEVASGTLWVLDRDRPSALFVSGSGTAELALARQARPLGVEGDALLYVKPSAREGALPTDPATGSAELRRVVVDPAGPSLTDELVSSLPPLRDTPRVGVARGEGGVDLLVSPGEAIDARSLRVLALDRASGSSVSVGDVDRFSEAPLVAVEAVTSGAITYVVWVEQTEEGASLRAQLVSTPP
jgi:hypothetical protein